MWTKLQPTPQANSHQPPQPTVDRAQLKREYAESLRKQQRASEIFSENVSVDGEIERAVQEHQEKAGAIHERRAAGIPVGEDELFKINEQLESRCKQLRSRAQQLQAEHLVIIRDTPQPGAIANKLIRSATNQLQCAFFHSQQSTAWLESRREAAGKTVAAIAQAAGNGQLDYGEQSLWEYELQQVQIQLETAIRESEAIRQKMLAE